MSNTKLEFVNGNCLDAWTVFVHTKILANFVNRGYFPTWKVLFTLECRFLGTVTKTFRNKSKYVHMKRILYKPLQLLK